MLLYNKNLSVAPMTTHIPINQISKILSKKLIIKKQIVETGLNSTCGRNLFITGRGSKLYNFDKYCSNFFEFTVKKPSSNNRQEAEEEIKQTFAACLGALRIIKDGWETEAIPKKLNEYTKKTGFFNRIFSKRL